MTENRQQKKEKRKKDKEMTKTEIQMPNKCLKPETLKIINH